ncbi:MAG: hypothetical protein CMJ27_13360, partial [Phycisphaerae bacterium]
WDIRFRVAASEFPMATPGIAATTTNARADARSRRAGERWLNRQYRSGGVCAALAGGGAKEFGVASHVLVDDPVERCPVASALPVQDVPDSTGFRRSRALTIDEGSRAATFQS